MKKITINTQSDRSVILVGEKWIDYKNYTDGKPIVIITDDNLLNFYGKDFGSVSYISLAPGESSKSLETIDLLAKRLLDLGLDRNGFIVGIGGGVVCDIAGFLASVYMRGISFGFVSASLLSQVDASVGGKNGVNSGPVKNILGTFSQPDFVICDPDMLKTLPDDEYLSGLAELIKHGAICDHDLFRMIEENTGLIAERNKDLLEKLISRSVEIKAEVVNEDEKEKGKRMILNFGHTFGHAIEAHTGMKHGFAVAAGMVIAADISVVSGVLKTEERERLYKLLDKMGLLKPYKIKSGTLSDLIARDKKKSGNAVNFIMIESIGKSLVRKIPLSSLMDRYNLIYEQS